MLQITDLHVAYGAIQALTGVSLEINAGEIVTLIGGNGAGKTTTLRAVSGLLRAKSGAVRFAGEDITGLAPHTIVGRGLCHVPEGRMIFANLTVAENLAMGAYLSTDPARDERNREFVFTTFPRLKERLTQTAGTLSGGEQQMLAIGRALVGRPRLLLLDEPSLGLAPLIVAKVFEVIAALSARGIAVVLVEQNARAALKLAARGYVLETGRITLTGTGPELAADRRVRDAYLGEG